MSSVGKNVVSNSRVFFSNDVFSEKEEIPTRGGVNTQGGGGGLSPLYFVNSPPPGLTPNRYPNRTFNFNVGGQPQAKNTPNTTIERHMYDNNIGVKDYNPSMTSLRENGGVSAGKVTPGHQTQSQIIGTPSKQNPAGIMGRAISTPTNKDPEQALKVENGGSGSRQRSERDLNLSSSEKKKPVILEESKDRFVGKLKFFDENKNYGFLIMEQDGSDIFVHYDDLSKAGMTKDLLKKAKDGLDIKFSFQCMSYMGKYNKSRKAVELQVLGMTDNTVTPSNENGPQTHNVQPISISN